MRQIFNFFSVSVYLLSLFTFFFSSDLSAEKRKYEPLEAGMSYAQVLESWGAPDSKIEYETKREIVRLFEKGEVIFARGKLKSWKYADPSLVDKNPASTKSSTEDAKRYKPTAELEESADSDYVVEEILDELLKQTPEGKK